MVLLLLALAILLSLAIGSVVIPPADLLSVVSLRLRGRPIPEGLHMYSVILFDLRFPRTALFGLVGAALAGSGAAYQGFFRNPLADPYLIGVASGAGLGAVVAMTRGLSGLSFGGLLLVPLAAFAGSLLTVALVYRLARVGRTTPTTNLILAGVAVSSFATALSSFLMLTSEGELRRALVWLMGGASMNGWKPVLALLPFILPGLGLLLLSGHALNVLQFGEEQARQMGLRVDRLRFLVITAASLTTAAAVAFAGIIGFVGLIVPHLVRFLWGADYRRILPVAILSGAAFLLFADVLSRIVLRPNEIPVGIVTALAGAPFFLWILRRARQQAFW